VALALTGRRAGVRRPRRAGWRLLGASDGTHWVGGRPLVRVNQRSHAAQTVAVPKGLDVVALAADGPAIRAAVNYDQGSSELWRVVGNQVDRRISIHARAVSSLTAEESGVTAAWYRPIRPG
jgi:hypothetical protein